MIESEEELDKLTEGTVVIRSHGVPKSICEKLKNRDWSVWTPPALS